MTVLKGKIWYLRKNEYWHILIRIRLPRERKKKMCLLRNTVFRIDLPSSIINHISISWLKWGASLKTDVLW